MSRRPLACALALLLGGCVGSYRMAEQPFVPPCRTAERVGNGADGGEGRAPDVRWISPGFPEVRQLLSTWCETVGGVVVDPTPDSVSREGVDSLAVVTWNTHIGGGDVEGLVHDLRAGNLPGVPPLEHFVLLLQEVYRSAPRVPAGEPPIRVPEGHHQAPPGKERTDVVRTAQRLGLSLFYVPSMRNGYTGNPATEEDRGNAILSTLPLSGFTVVELPVQLQRRAAALAAVSGTTAAGEPWCLRVASVHLDVILNGVQAGALGEALAPEHTLVFGGDFNFPTSRFGPIRYLRGLFPGSPPAAYGKTHPNGRLDYLFFRSADGAGARADRLDHPYGSDHFPVLGWFPVPRGSAEGCAPGAPSPTTRRHTP